MIEVVTKLDRRISQLEQTQIKPVVGEITDDSPLTVALAGGTPVPAKRVAGATLNVGDLVFCLTWPGQTIVIGAIE